MGTLLTQWLTPFFFMAPMVIPVHSSQNMRHNMVCSQYWPVAGKMLSNLWPINCTYLIRSLILTNTTQLIETLQQVKVVVHAAGPFADTARQMIDACLQTGTHYLDINGDINVFEQIKNLDTPAKEKNIMLLPGAGFDVVPTDCMALHLKNKLPDATHLKLAFASIGGGVSHGTAMTIVNKLGEGGAARENGANS